MSAASVKPTATYIEPLVGWRFWRVQRIKTLDHGTRYRLCAAGSYGRPKVWQPRAAVVAVCSARSSLHDAPHPKHECGIYAYRERADAESKLASMWAYDQYWMVNGRRERTYDTWAIGRVSLWGRVVECELGWRAQYAYPYDLTIYSNVAADEAVARDYAIDATGEPRRALRILVDQYPKVVAKAKEDAEYDKWYEETIFGRMDRYFLKPYHEEVMARLDRIDRSLARLSRKLASVGKDSDAG